MAIAAGVAAVGASVYSANKQNKTAREAAAQQQAGVEKAQQFSAEAAKESSKMLDPLAALVQPGLAASNAQASRYQQLGERGISALTAQQAPLDVNQFLNPGMQFAMQQGQKAIEGSLAARGLSQSGAALKELTQFGQGLATQNYNQAVNQAMQNRNQQLGIADSLVGLGQTGTNIQQNMLSTGINALGQQANITAMQGTNAGNLAMTSANVGAAATAAQKDLLGTAVNTGLSMYSAGMFSDEDLKQEMANVSDDDIEEFLSQMDPIEFEYTAEAKAKGAQDGRMVGVKAQDVERSKVGRNIVEEDEDEDKMLDIPKSVSALLASTASLNRRIKKLESK